MTQDERLNWFKELTTKTAQDLLDKIWSEEWITRIGESKLNAYKAINEAQAKTEGVYLPSRVLRGVTEWVGRIIRGQHKRMSCYYDCIQIVEWLGIQTTEQKLVSVVRQHCRNTAKNGEKTYYRYKKVMIEQTIEMIKNLHQRLGEAFSNFIYTDFVKPKIKRYTFPYAPDDDQAIKYTVEKQTINLEIKLPTSLEPKKRSDWVWIEQTLFVPEKIEEKIAQAIYPQPLKPTLRTKNLKAGLEYFFLQFPWEYPGETIPKEGKERVLAVDPGLKKVATCVVCEDGKQISKPIFINMIGGQYRHIERLYGHIAGIQRQLSKQKKKRPSKQIKVARREEERSKLYQKRNRLGEELAHYTTNKLIEIAQKWQCTKIAIEDLRDYKPPRGKRSWSRKLSYWLRGRIVFLLDYKCRQKGLTLVKVCPWNTSSHCSRCSAKGLKVKGPNNLLENKCGRFFHCPECGFTADRDYNASVNIYRASFIDYVKIKSLKDTSPVPYMDSGTLHSTIPSGGSEMSCNKSSGLVVVTGDG